MGKDLIHCEECTLEFAYRDFFLVKKMAGKPGGVLAHQIIQSFEPGEVSVKQAHQLGMELAKRALPGYQYIVCTHTDRDHIHNHIVFNSVSYLTQRKYLGSKASLRVMQAISDDLCREYGLSVIRKGGRRGLDKTTYELARKGKSWKAALAAVWMIFCLAAIRSRSLLPAWRPWATKSGMNAILPSARRGRKRGSAWKLWPASLGPSIRRKILSAS